MNLNERLKFARTQKGFTQQEVADILHISRATVSSWEVGRTLPSIDFIIDLSNLYDLSLDILLKEDMTMINQINKELRTKKIYKILVLAISVVLSVFIVINIAWLSHVKTQYESIEKTWTDKNNYYEKITNNSIYRVNKPKYLDFSNTDIEVRNSDFQIFISDIQNDAGIGVTILNNNLIKNLDINNSKIENIQYTIVFNSDFSRYTIATNLAEKKIDEKNFDSLVTQKKDEIKQLYYNSLDQWKEVNL